MWTMTPRPPSWNRMLVKHAIIGTEALQNVEEEWIWNHLWDLHHMLHSASDAANDLRWIGRMAGPLLVNKNILVDRSRHDNGRLWSRVDDKRMGYTVEPPNVLIWMLPRLVVRDLVTPLLLGNDMQSKLEEGSNNICWGKRHNCSRRSGNGLNISLLPQNPLGKVTHYLLFAGHDPSRVPAHILKRCHVSSLLVRPPGDMTMLH